MPRGEVSDLLRDRRLLPPGEIERRRREVAPLYAYCARHDLMISPIVRRASRVYGGFEASCSVVSGIKRGRCLMPSWYIPACCAVIGRPVAEVMGCLGPEWVAEFGAKYGVSAEEPAA